MHFFAIFYPSFLNEAVKQPKAIVMTVSSSLPHYYEAMFHLQSQLSPEKILCQ